jgi:repressor LexA
MIDIDKIITLINQQGHTCASVEKSLHFGNGAIRRWKTSSPSVDKIYKLSNFLNISLSVLMPDELSTGSAELTSTVKSFDEPKEILSAYEKSPDNIKRCVRAALEPYMTEIAQEPHIDPSPPGGRDKRSAGRGSSSIIQFNQPDEAPPIMIPIVGKAAAGFPIEMIEEDYGEIPVTDRSVRPGDFAVYADGDSMIDFGINDGDTVIIHPQPVVDNYEIALVAVDNGSTIKKVRCNETTIELIPMNDAHETQVYDLDEGIRILGKFVTVI